MEPGLIKNYCKRIIEIKFNRLRKKRINYVYLKCNLHECIKV